MSFLDFPELTREDLAEMASWTLLREARRLVKDGKVEQVEWTHPELIGKVVEGGETFSPVLNLRSTTFVKNKCECRTGRGGHVCTHSLALYLAAHALEQQPVAPPEEPVKETPVPESGSGQASVDHLSFLKTSETGDRLSARIWMPPNLESAAQRNAIVVKLELIPSTGEPTSPEKIFRGASYALTEATRRVLSIVESLCGGSLYSLVQLKRSQLRELLSLAGEGVSFTEGKNGEQEVSNSRISEQIIPFIDNLEKEAASRPEVKRSREVRNRQPQTPSPRPPARELLPDNWMVVDGSPKFLSILLRDRDDPQYKRCAEWLRSEGFRKEPRNGRWWLRDQHKVLNFLALRRERLDRDYSPGYTKNFKERTQVIQPVPLAFETVEGEGGYQLRMELRAEGVELRDIRNALVSGRHYIVQAEKVYLLEKKILDKFERVSRTLGGDPNLPMIGVFQTKVGNAELVHTESVLDELDMEASLPSDWIKRSAAIREVGRLEPPPIPAETAKRFRAYQLLGTAWLWHLHQNGLGGILADEMGLGKTIQAIGLLLSWKNAGEYNGPALVVVPASLIGNWQRELTTWGPGLEVYVHHGPSRLTELADDFHPDVCLTSYSTLRNDRQLFEGAAFSLAFADEAQHVKNRRSHASRSLRAVHAGSRFVLTGTPIENSVDDLRALFEFCLPGYLKRPPSDARGEERVWYEKQDLEKAAPYILRRGKALVAPELPEKIEQTLWCTMESGQQEIYHSVREKAERMLMDMASAGASENRMRFTMLTELLRLRQVCADPGLLDADYPLQSSSKFQAFRELLSEAMDGGHRILVFSQFVKLLKRLRQWLDAEDIRSEYIDGSTRDRLAVCDRFNDDAGIPVCLISLKAGGTGLNLTGADTVVHFDPWWNPAVEDQATDRAHRIGQSRTVTSYKLVTEGTVENKVLALQMKKSILLKDLLDESAIHSAKVDLSTLTSLLS